MCGMFIFLKVFNDDYLLKMSQWNIAEAFIHFIYYFFNFIDK